MSGLKKENIKNIYELTPLQEGILFHYLNKKLANPYFEQASIFIKGKIDSEIFMESWNEVLNRHDIFRTIFVYKNVKEPVQIVLKYWKHNVTFEDISVIPEEEQEKLVEKYRAEDIEKGFNISKEPPVRIKLFKLSENNSVFVWSFHHILIDGWSLKTIYSEFIQLYNAKLKGENNFKLPSPVQFREFVKWLKVKEMKKSLEYWEKYLDTCTVPTKIPQIVNFKDGYELGETEFLFNENLTERLKNFSQKTGITLNNLVRTLWGILVAYFNRTNYGVYGATVAGRPPDLKGVDEIVGLFINAIPVKILFNEHETFQNIAKKAQIDSIESREHQYCSLAEIQAISKLKNNLIDHIFVFENYPESEEETVAGFKTVDFKLYEHTNYNFEIQIFPEKRLRFRIRFNKNRINRDFIKNIKACLILLAESILENHKISEAFKLLDKNLSKFFKRVDIKITSSFVSEELKPYLETYLFNFKYIPDVQFAKYNNVFQELLSKDSLINTNKTGINFIFTRPEDWIRDLSGKSNEVLLKKLDDTYSDFINLLKNYEAFATTFVGIFETPELKNKELQQKIKEIYEKMEKAVKGLPNIFAIDFRDCKTRFGLNNIFDLTKDLAGHIPFSDIYFVAMANNMARSISATFGHPFKVIVVDCDNTLWEGVVGEAGYKNVKIYGGYKYLQKWLIQKYSEGFLIALCSKNEEHDVRNVFEKNKDMLLKEEHIVTSRINWKRKSENLLDMAEELNLGINSFVFIDDSVVECSEVMTEIPEIFTLRIPNEKSIPLILQNFWGCDKLKITEEDKNRTKMYIAEKKRKTTSSKLSETEFLEKLGIVIDIHSVKPSEIERASQLTLRTNQFNMSTIRRQIPEIKELIQADSILFMF